MLAQLFVKRLGRFFALHVPFAGRAKAVLHGGQPLVEQTKIAFEFTLPLIRHRQHQLSQIIEHWHQLIPVEALLNSLTHGLRLRLLVFGKPQILEQSEQRRLDTLGDSAIGLLWRRWQPIRVGRLTLRHRLRQCHTG